MAPQVHTCHGFANEVGACRACLESVLTHAGMGQSVGARIPVVDLNDPARAQRHVDAHQRQGRCWSGPEDHDVADTPLVQADRLALNVQAQQYPGSTGWRDDAASRARMRIPAYPLTHHLYPTSVEVSPASPAPDDPRSMVTRRTLQRAGTTAPPQTRARDAGTSVGDGRRASPTAPPQTRARDANTPVDNGRRISPPRTDPIRRPLPSSQISTQARRAAPLDSGE
ncbi:hypothetical protein LTR53_013794 [Teratosphaeriaceae sp. CCFEE 6253]|nr:hypothetical protein LTR53_013794 [Teratosphaeriaceae sp. CCFEE 6253]